MNNTCNIYVIKNTINNKVYVGQTWRSLKVRFAEHRYSSRCLKLNRAINKYEADNFIIELIAQCSDQATADYLETSYIKEYDSIQNGYNLKEGGNNGKLSEETKKKIGLIHKGKPKSEEQKRKMSAAGKTRKFTEETKRKMSAAKKRKQSGRKPYLGHKHSTETKTRIAAFSKGRIWKLINGKRVWVDKPKQLDMDKI